MALNVKRAIKKYGTTVGDVADRMNISRVSLSRHIHGNPSVDVLTRIAEAIGCGVPDLFDDAAEAPKDTITCPYCGGEIELTAKRKQ